LRQSFKLVVEAIETAAKNDIAAWRRRQPLAIRLKKLLDLSLFELDVLLGDWVVFAKRQLLGLCAAVLAGHVEEAGVGARQELDLDVGGFGHDR
jgi:hypothetical protein